VVEKTKNPSELTEEDNSIIEQIYVQALVTFHDIITKYRTPLEYVQKYVLKTLKSDKKFAVGRVTVNSFTQKYDRPPSPGRLNEDLAKEAKHFLLEGDDAYAFDKFLHPRDMSGVIDILEEGGVLVRIVGKKEISSRTGVRRRPGRIGHENSSESSRRTGGRPTACTTTEMVEKVKRVMSKQEARDLLRKKLLKMSLTYKFERFMIMVAFHTVKIDVEVAEKMLRLVAPQENLPQLVESRPSIQLISSLDDQQIEMLADRISKWSAETRPYDLQFLFYLAKL
jgi:hypothetical protein